MLNKQLLLGGELLWELRIKPDDQISTRSWVAGQRHSLSCHQLAVLWTTWNKGYLKTLGAIPGALKFLL